MKVTFGSTIDLPTKYGDFLATYVFVNDQNIFREGVLLKSKCESWIDTFVRIQSSCLFSESFWATDCDCALQLQTSMQKISAEGGYVLYFYEEGRGAGLETKFKAIELQQIHNYDTKTAYECLNMTYDVRSYELASAVLKEKLGKTPIVLLTNNMNKVNGLEKNGLVIRLREPLICGIDKPEIRKYLEEKKRALGHLIP